MKDATIPANRRKKWSSDRVIQEIQTLHQDGHLLNPQALGTHHASLLAAGRRYFGSWPDALKAAQVPQVSGRRGSRRHSRGYWTSDRILHDIRHYALLGHALYAHAMQQLDNQLVSAATYHFGSWSEALRAAGFDPEQVRATQRHSHESIISDIQSLMTHETDFRDSIVRQHHRPLYWAAQKYFGSWANALAQAKKLPCPKSTTSLA